MSSLVFSPTVFNVGPIHLHTLFTYELSIMLAIKDTALGELSVNAVMMLQESFLQASLSKLKQIYREHKGGSIRPFVVH